MADNKQLTPGSPVINPMLAAYFTDFDKSADWGTPVTHTATEAAPTAAGAGVDVSNANWLCTYFTTVTVTTVTVTLKGYDTTNDNWEDVYDDSGTIITRTFTNARFLLPIDVKQFDEARWFITTFTGTTIDRVEKAA